MVLLANNGTKTLFSANVLTDQYKNPPLKLFLGVTIFGMSDDAGHTERLFP